MRGRTAAAIAALLLAAVGAGSAVSAAADPPPAGALAFTHRCGMCHRDGGTGTYVLARRLGADLSLLEKRSDLKPEYIRYVVRWGITNMPRISRVEVPDKDLDAIVTYLTATGR
jgi:mono/diheme cytochrome c family protein